MNGISELLLHCEIQKAFESCCALISIMGKHLRKGLVLTSMVPLWLHRMSLTLECSTYSR
jgi:hypothetical protein